MSDRRVIEGHIRESDSDELKNLKRIAQCDLDLMIFLELSAMG